MKVTGVYVCIYLHMYTRVCVCVCARVCISQAFTKKCGCIIYTASGRLSRIRTFTGIDFRP